METASASLQSILLEFGYDVMISTEIVEPFTEKMTTFLKNFDVIIYQQSFYKSLNHEIVGQLLTLERTVFLFSFGLDEKMYTIYKETPNLYIHFYPLSVSKVLENIESNVCISVKEQEEDSFISLNQQYTKKEKEYSYQLRGRTLIIMGRCIQLTKKEALLLACFSDNPETVLPSDVLCKKLWPNENSRNRQSLLSGLFKRIRSKVEESTDIPSLFILNKKGMGYYVNPLFVKKENEKILLRTSE